MRQKLIELRREINKFTNIVGDFKTTQSVIDRSSRQKISTDLVEWNSTINQLDLVDNYRILHQTTVEYTFVSSSHGTVTKIDYIPDHKTHLNKFKRIEII